MLKNSNTFTFRIVRGVGTETCMSVNYYVRDVESGDILHIDGYAFSPCIQFNVPNNLLLQIVY